MRRSERRLTLFARVLITNTVLLVLAPLVAGLLHSSGRHHFDPRFAIAAGVPLLFRSLAASRYDVIVADAYAERARQLLSPLA
jgi:hypothetical protein